MRKAVVLCDTGHLGAIVIAPCIGGPGLIGDPRYIFSGYRDCQGGAGLSSSKHVVNLVAWDDRWD